MRPEVDSSLETSGKSFQANWNLNFGRVRSGAEKLAEPTWFAGLQANKFVLFEAIEVVAFCYATIPWAGLWFKSRLNYITLFR